MKIKSALCFALLAWSFSYPSAALADKEKCAVNALRYVNKSLGYTVKRLSVGYITADGEKAYKNVWGTGKFSPDSRKIWADEDKVINLDDMSADVQNAPELWLVVHIDSGESKSCRKNKHKLVYSADKGGEIRFKTGGTTRLNNACKFYGKIEEYCKTP